MSDGSLLGSSPGIFDERCFVPPPKCEQGIKFYHCPDSVCML